MNEDEIVGILRDMVEVQSRAGEQITIREASEKLAVMWEIIHVIADPDNEGFYDDDDKRLRIECDWCNGEEVGSGKELSYRHTPGCIVTKARMLLGYSHPDHHYPSDEVLDHHLHYEES